MGRKWTQTVHLPSRSDMLHVIRLVPTLESKSINHRLEGLAASQRDAEFAPPCCFKVTSKASAIMELVETHILKLRKREGPGQHG